MPDIFRLRHKANTKSPDPMALTMDAGSGTAAMPSSPARETNISLEKPLTILTRWSPTSTSVRETIDESVTVWENTGPGS